MRIARLDLTRYGRFNDYQLDFGAAPLSGSDFHIVYGLNETGKSTAAAGILDLLFGIEKQSAYGAAKGRASVPNWHPYNAMRIGARLELGERAYEVARLKRDKNSLVGADDRPLDESLLTAELAGVDREAFHMMFSLDDESLEKGGEAILASHGDLGQLLFSASAGLAEISDRLDWLRRKADGFYRPRASTTELAELKRELDALKEERDAADTLAPAYAELVRQRDAARQAYAAAAKSLSERRAREDEIQRLLGALPRLAALREAESQCAPLEALAVPPDGWRDEVQQLQAEAIRLAAQKESAEREISALEDQLRAHGRRPGGAEGRGSGRRVARAQQPLRQRRGHPRAAGRTCGQARRGRRHPASPRPRERGRPGQAYASGSRRGRARGSDRRPFRGVVETRGGGRSSGGGAKRACPGVAGGAAARR